MSLDGRFYPNSSLVGCCFRDGSFLQSHHAFTTAIAVHPRNPMLRVLMAKIIIVAES